MLEWKIKIVELENEEEHSLLELTLAENKGKILIFAALGKLALNTPSLVRQLTEAFKHRCGIEEKENTEDLPIL